MTAAIVAALGSAVVGGVSSNMAADKSAAAAKKGMNASSALSAQARQDAMNLFGQGRESAQLGIGGALDFYKGNLQQRNQPLIQGNMMAQQAAGQGGIQANNAILGLPVDMSFANNPQQVTADYSGINSARLPMLGLSFAQKQAPIDAEKLKANADAKKKASKNIWRISDYANDPRNQY